jgi:dTDP-4-dehydrorhamnose reductase
MRIAVVGAAGQLGAAVVHVCRPAHDVIALNRAALDVARQASVDAAIDEVRPDAIVNCSGYNAVDAAETHPVEALEVNAFGVRALARSARAHGAMLVHYSTDFVFDGEASRPYTEEDPANPRSTYAASKLLGEWFAADAPAAWVLRVESLFGRAPGGPPAKGSLAAIVEALQAGRPARVFSDKVVSPTSVLDVAHATRLLLERRIAPGLYHCVNSGSGTWVEIAQEAARLLGVDARLDIVRMADLALPAARPMCSVLSNAKLASAGIVMPAWQDALARALRGSGDEARHQPADREARGQAR